MITKLQQRQLDQTQLMLLHMSGDVHPNPATKYPCPVCTCNATSRGVSYKYNRCSGWVHAKCFGLLNAVHYRTKSDWTCDTSWVTPKLPTPCCCLPTPMTLSSGRIPIFPLVVHLASSAVTRAGSVHKSRGDNVVHMWVQLKR